jgi:hypothetical protein
VASLAIYCGVVDFFNFSTALAKEKIAAEISSKAINIIIEQIKYPK